jgi:hypothetical protein
MKTISEVLALARTKAGAFMAAFQVKRYHLLAIQISDFRLNVTTDEGPGG